MSRIGGLLIIAILCLPNAAWAQSTEKLFKQAASVIAEMDQKALKAGTADAKWVKDSLAVRDVLKAAVKDDPESAWADDAQYVVTVLSALDRTNAAELEMFLRRYPEAKAEEWTKEKLSYLVSSKLSLELSARMELAKVYAERKDKQKLKELAETSAKKYPDRKIFFETLARRSEAS